MNLFDALRRTQLDLLERTLAGMTEEHTQRAKVCREIRQLRAQLAYARRGQVAA